MTRYMIDPDVALRLAPDQAVIGADHQILAPALLRSQLPSLLCQAGRRKEMPSDTLTMCAGCGSGCEVCSPQQS